MVKWRVANRTTRLAQRVVMLSLPKHPARFAGLFNKAVEMLRQAQHDDRNGDS
jgi:hypothetical protein